MECEVDLEAKWGGPGCTGCGAGCVGTAAVGLSGECLNCRFNQLFFSGLRYSLRI